MGRKLPFFPVYHHRGKLSISNFAEVQKTPLRRQKQRGQGKEDYWFFTESWGANKDLSEAPKSCTRKEHESATNPIAKRGQGAMPLAGSRDSVPCGVWGNAPTVFRALNFKEAANKGAGSEASLPVTKKSSNIVQVTWETTAEGVQRAIADFVRFHCLLELCQRPV